MTINCYFTSMFSVNSTCWKSVVKHTNIDCMSEELYDGKKCAPIAKQSNADHMSTLQQS